MTARSLTQMKEDGARRRAFELLIEALMGGSDQRAYRQRTGRELTDDVLKRFGYQCFKCEEDIPFRGRRAVDRAPSRVD